MKYDYREAVADNVREWVKENVKRGEYDNSDDLYEYLQDTLWVEDSVTGNASGSYFCNAYKAAECLVGNWDLLAEALSEFGESDINPIEKGEEWCDVTIRCYILGEAIAEVIDELDDEGFFDEEEEGEEDND